MCNRAGVCAAVVLIALFVLTEATRASVILNWEDLGGLGSWHEGNRSTQPFSPIDVTALKTISSEAVFVNEVGTLGSDFFVFASAEVDDIWRIVATTAPIERPYGTVTPLVFVNYFPIVGSIARLHIGPSIAGVGNLVGLNGGAGTDFIFQTPAIAGIPEPATLALLCLGLVSIGFSCPSRLVRTAIPSAGQPSAGT